eukprot:TRINITY_DN31367_c0_g2_i1.p1 TRINITY_DN31367_c0_g2~~TRINITY_DN31367_c0_g2_i1.p1  ORF type:complete len:327 (-),score=75.37 TRINITY_DN31367_c0_g2_i1:205-1185(-)
MFSPRRDPRLPPGSRQKGPTLAQRAKHVLQPQLPLSRNWKGAPDRNASPRGYYNPGMHRHRTDLVRALETRDDSAQERRLKQALMLDGVRFHPSHELERLAIKAVSQHLRGSGRPLIDPEHMVLVLGPPGCGKGTQCRLMSLKHGLPHFKTRDVVKENLDNGTLLGMRAAKYSTDAGAVPGDLVAAMLGMKLRELQVQLSGCFSYGFPNSLEEARALVEAGVKVSKVIFIDVSDDVSIARTTGRRVDPNTGDVYHVEQKPPPSCLTPRLILKAEDSLESARARLQVFRAQSEKVLRQFQDRVIRVDGSGSPEEVNELLLAALCENP